MKISNAIVSLFLLLPLLTLIPNPSPNMLDASDNMINSGGLPSETLERLAQLEQIVNETQQKELQAQKEKALLQQQKEEEEQQKELQ